MSDEKELTVNTWEDIEEIRKVISNGIIDLAKVINQLIDTYKDDVKTHLTEDEKKTLGVSLSMFKKDIESISKDIGKIYLKHKGKTGEIKDDVDIADAINAQLQYIGIKELFFTVITPTYLNIVEMIERAVNRGKGEGDEHRGAE